MPGSFMMRTGADLGDIEAVHSVVAHMTPIVEASPLEAVPFENSHRDGPYGLAIQS